MSGLLWRLCFAFHVLAGIATPQTPWKQVCSRSTATPLTLPTFAHVETESDLQYCNSTALYYGFDRPADWPAALQCAYYQRAHPQAQGGDPFDGSQVLTMLYANGRGVPRNYDLAIRFACENPSAAEAEMTGRIGHLEHLRDTRAAATNFDLCDDATSGLLGGACESIRQQFATVKRHRELDTISAQWSPPIKEAFKSLEAAEEAFENARVSNEVDLSGTLRAAFSLEEQGRLSDQFLINLRRFAQGDIPPASPSDYQNADRGLNAAYERLQRAPDTAWQGSTVKPSGIRETERAWLKLRDAWVEFGRLAYPRTSADTVRAQITRLRLHQLQSLYPR